MLSSAFRFCSFLNAASSRLAFALCLLLIVPSWVDKSCKALFTARVVSRRSASLVSMVSSFNAGSRMLARLR